MKQRTVKDYHVRKNEILDAAKEMFFTTGYEKVSIQQIIDKVQIAKGTLYYYFKSKIDLLDDLVKRELAPLLAIINEVKDENSISATEKLNKIFSQVSSWKIENINLYQIVFKLMYSDANLKIRQKFLNTQFDLFAPIYAEIIEEGINDGVYECDDPLEIANLLLIIGDRIKQKLAEILEKETDKEKIISVIISITENYENIIERILGMRSEKITILDRNKIQKMNRG